MADRFGLNSNVRELKIGRTFEQNSSQQSSFHTVRYDFKPASVDSTRDGVLQVDENQSVSITVPHMHGNGQTNFSEGKFWKQLNTAPLNLGDKKTDCLSIHGRVKPANQKECILIIDRETGEITLEALKSQILVKKTRPEKNPDPPALNISLTSTPSSSASSRPQMPTERLQPMPIGRPQPSTATLLTNHARSSSPTAALVMPTMSTSEMNEAKKKPTPPPPAAASVTMAALSSSSSSSSSSSDDSSSSSDSGSDNEDDLKPAASVVMSMPSFTSAIPSTTPPSMPSFMQMKPNAPPQGRIPQPILPRLPVPRPSVPTAPSRLQTMSMPQFLNDDLQLSESEDDSD